MTDFISTYRVSHFFSKDLSVQRNIKGIQLMKDLSRYAIRNVMLLSLIHI